MSKKNILITGCAGFIGYHLTKYLAKNNDNHIIGIDNMFTGSIDNLKELKKLDNFEFIRHDVIFPIYIEVDEIYHLASPASPIYYQQTPIKTVKTNLLGTLNMLGLAKRMKCKILFTSTSEVYGNPNQHPQKEGYFGNVNPIGKRACYDEGKRIAETLMMDYKRQHNVKIKIVRIFNTYGPNMSYDDGRVVSNFIVQALRNDPISIYGDGNQTRSFCYIDDMVDGISAMMDTDLIITGPINLGNDQEISVIALAEKIRSIIGSNSEIIYKSLPEDDPVRRKPDLTLAANLLKWSPSIGIENGLKKTINYFKEIIC
ncbi:SDR family oxidoreductase [candidate division WOR-3 bacterium]|nr:SDR family oxidoreductase [candidate division WOR-3 bacterium]